MRDSCPDRRLLLPNPDYFRFARHPPANRREGFACLPIPTIGRWAVLRASVAAGHLRSLRLALRRVQNEFERAGVLVFLHQLEIDEPFGLSHRLAILEPVSRGFEERSCKLVFAVGDKALYCRGELLFGHAQIISQEFCAVRMA